jgi:ABC-type multidrug transport system fused ATPase/permease subunit
MIKYISLYRKQWIALGFCILLTSLFPSFIPLINKILVDKVFLENQFELFFYISIVFVTLLFVTAIANYYRHKTIQILGEEIKVNLSSELYRKVMSKSLLYFEKNETGKVLSLFQADIPQVIRIYKELIPSGIQVIFQIIFSTLVLLYVSKVVLLLVFIFLPISIFVSNSFKKKIRNNSLKYQEALENVNSSLHDNLMGAKEILLHTNEDHNIKEMNSKFRISLNPTKKLSRDLGISNGLNFFIYWSSFLVVFIVGGILTTNGEITLGSFIAMLSYFMSLFGPINFLIEIFNSFQSTFGAQKRLSKLFQDLDIECVKDRQTEKTKINSVEFENVSFEYEKNQRVLENISFSLKKGDMVSVVGASGVGKTTLVNLILKVLINTSGSIQVNDIPISQWSQRNLLKRISFLSQDYYLFNKTIKENIKFANPTISDEELVLISKKVGAYDFISKLKDQYAYEMGYNGNNLSGGQKQRIGLTRALAKDFDILILDEGTSSLDHLSAEEVINFLIELKKEDKIIILITHDLELAKRSDKIFQLEKGSLNQFIINENTISHNKKVLALE